MSLSPQKLSKQKLLDGSPFLLSLAHRFPQYLDAEPDKVIQELCQSVLARARSCQSEAEIKKLIRTTRNSAALVIALADIEKVWTLEQVTLALTNTADACLNAVINWLLWDSQNKGKLQNLDQKNPSQDCGYVVLAMGKHGGYELNFSSDIDLIILFDPERAPLVEGVEPNQFFVRLTKQMASIMQQMTGDGYAYRVDLRLRPDPRATQVAISFDAALIYYESVGQNWERAAMIKARPAAGDLALGHEFLQEIGPFIWRKYLDFAAIAQVHSLKKQINVVKGHGEIAVLGHDVKLGRGGIREIEFFVQTQQLIAGGRNTALRGTSTILMLDALVDASWVEQKTARELQQAYRFLRNIEHRIQMVEDQQTHKLPKEAETFERFAHFAGYSNGQDLERKLHDTLHLVQNHYDRLFKDKVGENNDQENLPSTLQFDSSEDDEETLNQLRALGFAQPAMVSSTIKGWYAGRYGAMRSEVARQRLTELLPALIKALAGADENVTGYASANNAHDADATFAAFDRFLSGLPTGIQLFSLLKANPQYLDLITNILGSAPRLAQELSRHPKMIDAVLEPNFFKGLPSKQILDALLAEQIPDTMAFDLVLDQARILAHEQMFRIGVRSLSNTLDASDAGRAYSNLAQCLIERLLVAVQADLAVRHGVFKTGRICVVAMGKLGGWEMTNASDLDLIVIYDHDENESFSDGSKPLSANQYFARMTQRLITSLSAPTSEGVLYEVDMRLRPSGNKGPIATHIDAFIAYQETSAWTWEKLALTRARVVAGDLAFKRQVERAIADCLEAPRDHSFVFKDAISMRKTMLQAKKPQSPWNIKSIRGGMVDLEFIVQSLLIAHAAESKAILSPNLLEAIEKLGQAKIISPQVSNRLSYICKLYQQLSQVLKLGLRDVFDPSRAPTGLIQLILSTLATPDIDLSQALLEDLQAEVTDIFETLIGPIE